MDHKSQLLATVEAAQKAFLEALVAAGDSGMNVGRLGNDVAVICQRLTRLMTFFARNPKLPAPYLFSLYHACWTHVKAHPRLTAPKNEMRWGTREILMTNIANHLARGGRITTFTEAVKLSGVGSQTLYNYYPALQHLLLDVMDVMMKDKE